MRRPAVLAIVAACSGPGATEPTQHEPAAGKAALDAGPVRGVVRVSDAPAPCGELGREDCFLRASEMVEGNDPNDQAMGVTILRAFCEEGDQRRCFEADVTLELRTQCRLDQLIDGCLRLADLYRRGVATCAYDTACAYVLYQMACTGGTESACTRTWEPGDEP